MDSTVAARLIELNRDFYTRFGDSFSATRRRIQPGVRRVLRKLKGDEAILDLGCGNGELARELAKRGHRGSYLGVDFSLPLLRDADSIPEDFPAAARRHFSAKFQQVDITQLPSFRDQLGESGPCPVITAFAVLHHIPSPDLRLDVLTTIHQLLAPDGLFLQSNWQFLNSGKLKARIQDWSIAGFSPQDVEPNDYLLDWRSGGEGLRYVHHFNESELNDLAGAIGFKVAESFYSDGEGGNLGLYQVWKPAL